MDDKLMTPQEVADLLGIKKDTVYVWVADRRLPHLKVGSLLRFRRSDIDRYLEDCARQPAEVA